MNRFDEILDRSSLSTMKWEAEIARAGRPELLCFGTADMDFRSPAPILDAIQNIIDAGHLGYPYVQDSFYAAIEAWLRRTAGWRIDARASISHNVSIYTAVWNVLDAFTKPGDEIIFQTPVHFCFHEMIVSNGRTAVMNPLRLAGGQYEMDFEQLERCFSPRTKIFWLCNPHNPVGRAWKKEELARLAELCIRHDVLILSDDVYYGLTYPGVSYTPIASLSAEVSMRTVTCYSPSKTYNTTGLKYSFVVAENRELMEGYRRSLHRIDLDYGVNLMGLAVTEAALTQCDPWLHEMMAYVSKNHALVTEAVDRSMPRLRVLPAEATYFAWVDARGMDLSTEGLQAFFLNEADIVVEYGESLGTGGEGFVRANLACPTSVLREGVTRLEAAYRKHFPI